MNLLQSEISLNIPTLLISVGHVKIASISDHKEPGVKCKVRFVCVCVCVVTSAVGQQVLWTPSWCLPWYSFLQKNTFAYIKLILGIIFFYYLSNFYLRISKNISI